MTIAWMQLNSERGFGKMHTNESMDIGYKADSMTALKANPSILVRSENRC